MRKHRQKMRFPFNSFESILSKIADRYLGAIFLHRHVKTTLVDGKALCKPIELNGFLHTILKVLHLLLSKMRWVALMTAEECPSLSSS